MQCRRCSAEIVSGDHWCDRCGLWSSSEGAVCEGEELQPANGVCVVCGTPVCDVCGTEKDGVSYCAIAAHPELMRTHIRLGRYGSMFEAEWISTNLSNAGVRAQMFEYRSHPGLHGVTLSTEASVFVPREDEEKARSIIDQYAHTKGT